MGAICLILGRGGFAVKGKQRRFVEAFLRTGDGELALREAGYRPSWTLAQMFRVKAVQKALGLTEDGKVRKADESEVAAYFTGVMRGDEAADKSQPGVKDQLRAAELLGKHLGMFEKRERGFDGETMEFVGDEEL